MYDPSSSGLSGAGHSITDISAATSRETLKSESTVSFNSESETQLSNNVRPSHLTDLSENQLSSMQATYASSDESLGASQVI